MLIVTNRTASFRIEVPCTEKGKTMSNAYNNGYQTGLNGGTVNTNGMSSTQKEATDAGVNAGRGDRSK